MASPAKQSPASGKEDFAALLEESLRSGGGFDGHVAKGRVISIEGEIGRAHV